MNNDNIAHFEERYDSVDTDELIELHRKGGLLPDAEEAALRVLNRRGITPEQRVQIASELTATSYDEQVKHLATTGSRLAARFLDTVFAIIFGVAASFLLGILSTDAAMAAGIIVFLGYFLFADSLPKGQSLGKKMNGIAVVDTVTGRKCHPLQSFARNLLLLVFGIIDMVFVQSHGRQRIGDRIAATQVLKVEYVKE